MNILFFFRCKDKKVLRNCAPLCQEIWERIGCFQLNYGNISLFLKDRLSFCYEHLANGRDSSQLLPKTKIYCIGKVRYLLRRFQLSETADAVYLLHVSKILDNLRRLLKEFKILKYYDGKNLEMVWEER